MVLSIPSPSKLRRLLWKVSCSRRKSHKKNILVYPGGEYPHPGGFGSSSIIDFLIFFARFFVFLDMRRTHTHLLGWMCLSVPFIRPTSTKHIGELWKLAVGMVNPGGMNHPFPHLNQAQWDDVGCLKRIFPVLRRVFWYLSHIPGLHPRLLGECPFLLADQFFCFLMLHDRIG